MTIRGSQSAFMWGRTVYTKHSGGCLRSILLKKHVGDLDIDASHQIRGHHNEDEYEKHLQLKGIPYVRELEVIDGQFTGHIDFWVDNYKVVELKSSQSKSRKADIKKGEYVTENLAQAVAYMSAQKTVHGELIYSFWEPNKTTGALEFQFSYKHKILIDDFGRICLNGTATQWTVYDLLSHQHHALKVQAEGIVWDRPNNHDLLWGSPCKYCPFSAVCDAYDAGTIASTEEFIEVAKRDVGSLANKTTSVEEVTNEQCDS